MPETGESTPAARDQNEPIAKESDSPSGESSRDAFERILGRSTGLKGATVSFSFPKSKPKTVAERLDDLNLDDREQTIKLKRFLAYGSFLAVGIQLILANAGMYLYAEAIAWELEPEVVMAWLAATVVETLGVVVIIARNLFPGLQSER